MNQTDFNRLGKDIFMNGRENRLISHLTSQRLLRLAVLYLCSRCSEFLAEEYVATDQSTIQLIKAEPAIKDHTTIKARAAAIEAAIKDGVSVVVANQFDDSISFSIGGDLLFLQMLRDKFAAICPRCQESLYDTISLLEGELSSRMYSAGLIREGPPDDAEEDMYYDAREDYYTHEVPLIQEAYAAAEADYRSYPYPEEDWDSLEEDREAYDE